MLAAASRPSLIAQTTSEAPRDDVASGEDAVDGGHHGAVVDLDGAPAVHVEGRAI